MTVTFAQSRVNQELAKEGIPLPFGNKFWASNWPTGKSPMQGLIVHLIPSVSLDFSVLLGNDELIRFIY
jgi:solute carrier family 7 (L-type amino acid transporter), member 9/15